MTLFTDYMAKAKKSARRVGRPSRIDLGMEPMQTVTTAVEQGVVKRLLRKHGSLAAALRYLDRLEDVSQS